MCSVNSNISNKFHFVWFCPFSLPGGSGRREQFVWRLSAFRRSREVVSSPAVVYMRKRKAESILTDFFLQTLCKNVKNLLKLRTAIALIDWTIRIHKCECIYWTQVDKIQLPCVLSCSSDSLWSESLEEVLSCPTSGRIRLGASGRLVSGGTRSMTRST